MSDGKKVGKNSVFRLPEKPTRPIEVLDSYDRFFIRKLRQAIQADRSRYTHGVPAYHQNLIQIVDSYAHDKVTSSYLSRKNLEHFLKGTDSRTPNLKVLDAYIQIVNPEIRKTFFVSTYVENFGNMLSEYTRPFVTEYERAKAVQDLVGTYYVHLHPERTTGEEIDDYLMIRRDASNRYLKCYHFRSTLRSTDMADPSPVLHLFTGFCIPAAERSFVIMRSYKYSSLATGVLEFETSNQGKTNFVIEYPNSRLLGAQMIQGPQKAAKLYRISNAARSAQVEAVVNMFENVF